MVKQLLMTEQSGSVDLEADNYYTVEKILDKKKQGKKNMFLVKWEGYPESEATWEPSSNLRNVKDMLTLFEAELVNKQTSKLADAITFKEITNLGANSKSNTNCSSNEAS